MAKQEQLPIPEFIEQNQLSGEARDSSSRRIAFGGVPHEKFWNIDRRELGETLIDEYKFLAQPAQLGRTLLPVERANHRYYYHGVLFPADEHQVLVISPERLAATAHRSALKANAGDLNHDRKMAKAFRAQGHALEQKRTKISTLIASYDTEKGRHDSLRSEMLHPKFAHKTEAEMRMVAAEAKEYWAKMLTTIAEQEEWSAEKMHGVSRAMDFYSVGSKRTKYSYRDAMNYWRDMMKLSSIYIGQKKRAAGQSLRSVENHLDNLHPQ